MNIWYFDPGEARWGYGSAASLLLQGHNVYVVQVQDNIDFSTMETIEVEVGNKHSTNIVQLKILKISPKITLSNKNLVLREIPQEITPNVIITASNYWKIAKTFSNYFEVPLIFWAHAASFGLYKIPVFIKYAKNYTKSLKLMLGFIYNYFRAHRSSYVLSRDILTLSTLKRLGIQKVDIVWPTYTRFTEENAYIKFLKGNSKTYSDIDRTVDLSSPYVLSVATLQQNSPSYHLEAKAIAFLMKVARKMPEVNFLLIGTSLEELNNIYGYTHPENLIPLGKIYDDKYLAKLYDNSLCVMTPIYLPGFTNRVLEAFFYHKATISTPIIMKSFEGLEHGVNILYSDTVTDTIRYINKILMNNRFRIALEENIYKYYLQYFSPEKHGQKLENILKNAIKDSVQ